MKWLLGFGRFWYDFIVGDSVVLAVGGVAVLGLGFLLAHIGDKTLAQVLLPLVVMGTVSASLAGRR